MRERAVCEDCFADFWRDESEPWKVRCRRCWFDWKFEKDQQRSQVPPDDLRCELLHNLKPMLSLVHLMEVWDSTPRIAFLSPEPGSGKSRALEATELHVPNPAEAVNVTPAYLFRKVGAQVGWPTILYDEIDTVFGPRANEDEEIRGLLAMLDRIVAEMAFVPTDDLLGAGGWPPEVYLTHSLGDVEADANDED